MASEPHGLTQGLSAVLLLGQRHSCGSVGAGLPSMKATVIAAAAVVLCAALVTAQFGGGGPGMTHFSCCLTPVMQRWKFHQHHHFQGLRMLLALGTLPHAGLGSAYTLFTYSHLGCSDEDSQPCFACGCSIMKHALLTLRSSRQPAYFLDFSLRSSLCPVRPIYCKLSLWSCMIAQSSQGASEQGLLVTNSGNAQAAAAHLAAAVPAAVTMAAAAAATATTMAEAPATVEATAPATVEAPTAPPPAAPQTAPPATPKVRIRAIPAKQLTSPGANLSFPFTT